MLLLSEFWTRKWPPVAFSFVRSSCPFILCIDLSSIHTNMTGTTDSTSLSVCLSVPHNQLNLQHALGIVPYLHSSNHKPNSMEHTSSYQSQPLSCRSWQPSIHPASQPASLPASLHRAATAVRARCDLAPRPTSSLPKRRQSTSWALLFHHISGPMNGNARLVLFHPPCLPACLHCPAAMA